MRVAVAERELERVRKTAQSGASSEQTLDRAQSELELAQAQLDVQSEGLALALEGPRPEDLAEARAQLAVQAAQVALLKARVRDLTLLGPSDGVIQSRLIEVGELAGPTRPAFTLALTDPKWVRAFVSEPDLARVRPGQTARIHSDSCADRNSAGWLGFISPNAKFTPRSVETTDLRTSLVYEVRVWAEDPDQELRLGMPVTVELGALAAEGSSDPSGSKAQVERGAVR